MLEVAPADEPAHRVRDQIDAEATRILSLVQHRPSDMREKLAKLLGMELDLPPNPVPEVLVHHVVVSKDPDRTARDPPFGQKLTVVEGVHVAVILHQANHGGLEDVRLHLAGVELPEPGGAEVEPGVGSRHGGLDFFPAAGVTTNIDDGVVGWFDHGSVSLLWSGRAAPGFTRRNDRESARFGGWSRAAARSIMLGCPLRG